MQIYTSQKPHEEVGSALSTSLQRHKNSYVLLLLAGGSALDVLATIDTTHINEYTTIMMMDERFTTKATENNFLQMTSTFFYTRLSNTQCNFLPSVPEKGESHEAFTQRIEKDLNAFLDTHATLTVLALFGIGADGHTAAIFPMEQKLFTDTYGQGNFYTRVTYHKNPFSNRSSITPKFIKRYVTESFVYAVGKEKLPVVHTITDPFELHELPTHIHEQVGSELFTDLSL